MLNSKGMRFPIDVILICIRWYAAYPLSYRHLEEIMEERGVSVDHSTINRWANCFLPLIEKMAHKYKRPVGGSWRMDETYIKVKGVWKYLYRAVDRQGKTVDFLLTAKRDMTAAKRFFDKAMGANGPPDKVAIDKSGANKAAMDAINARRDMPILVRQVKYLNNIVEQDHRVIKRITRPMLNFRSFRAAGSVLAGIELIHTIRKGQFAIDGADPMSLADQFSMLAGMVRTECVGQRPFREISSCDQQRDRIPEVQVLRKRPPSTVCT
jgi:putative transposase